MFSVENMVTGAPETIDITQRMVRDEERMMVNELKYKFPRNTWCRFDRMYKGIENEKELCHALMRSCVAGGFKICINKTYVVLDPVNIRHSSNTFLLFVLLEATRKQ